MKALLFFLCLIGLAHADSSEKKLGNVVEESYLDPTVEEAKMPGTSEAIEEVNTSPNPVPQAEEYPYNDVLIDGEYIDDEAIQKGEEDSSKEKK